MPCGKIKTNVCVRCKAFALGVYWPISYICDAIIIVVMSLYVIYLPLEKYLSQWAVHHLGNPVTFPAKSNENAIIRTYIQKLPDGMLPELDDGTMTAVAIPDSVAKPPERYNYMGRRGKEAVREAIKGLFVRNLWADIDPIAASSVGLNKLLLAWCEVHGISEDHVETVRQIYYRIRKSYAERGINLRDSSRKKNL